MGTLLENAKKIEILDNDYATVYCLPDDRIVYHRFKQFAEGDNFRNVITRAADAFEKYQCTMYLSDDTKIGVYNSEDTNWGEIHFTPRLVKAGWTHWVIMSPERVAGKIRLKTVIEHFKSFGVQVDVYDDVDKGYEFLTSNK